MWFIGKELRQRDRRRPARNPLGWRWLRPDLRVTRRHRGTTATPPRSLSSNRKHHQRRARWIFSQPLRRAPLGRFGFRQEESDRPRRHLKTRDPAGRFQKSSKTRDADREHRLCRPFIRPAALDPARSPEDEPQYGFSSADDAGGRGSTGTGASSGCDHPAFGSDRGGCRQDRRRRPSRGVSSHARHAKCARAATNHPRADNPMWSISTRDGLTG